MVSDKEVSPLYETIKMLAAEKETLQRRLEAANTTIHRLRIEIDNLHVEVDRARKHRQQD